MTLLILFLFISIIFSFLCSIWEAVLLSISDTQVEIWAEKGTATGRRLKQLKTKVDRPLAAILTLNTIAHTVGAIGVGAQASKIWGDSIQATLITPTVMTLAILILSEIIPKTIGASYWQRLIPFTVNSIHWLVIILSPLVWLSEIITKSLKKKDADTGISRAEFTAMAKIGEEKGVFKEGESRIIQNLLRFNTIVTRNVMTPRTVVKAAKETMTIRDFYDENKNLRFSRIPVYKENKDHINGFFLKDELLTKLINDEGDEPLSDIRRDILIVNDTLPIPDLFNRLMETREHIALVVDEFGGMAGIVTMEDVIETLLGMEIMDELDNIEDMQRLARANWEKRARDLGLLDQFEQEKESASDGESDEVSEEAK